MTLQEINTIVEQYEKLKKHIEDTALKLESIDQQTYNTGRGVESSYIDGDTVWVTYDDSCGGYYSTDSFRFSISFLNMSDEELTEAVKKEKEKREEEKRKTKEEKAKKEKADAEARELELYQKLKEKYE
jgi:hypothetical protein